MASLLRQIEGPKSATQAFSSQNPPQSPGLPVRAGVCWAESAGGPGFRPGLGPPNISNPVLTECKVSSPPHPNASAGAAKRPGGNAPGNCAARPTRGIGSALSDPGRSHATPPHGPATSPSQAQLPPSHLSPPVLSCIMMHADQRRGHQFVAARRVHPLLLGSVGRLDNCRMSIAPNPVPLHSTCSLCPRWQSEALVRHDKCRVQQLSTQWRDPPLATTGHVLGTPMD